jgi:hypothetical protein
MATLARQPTDPLHARIAVLIEQGFSEAQSANCNTPKPSAVSQRQTRRAVVKKTRCLILDPQIPT